MNFDTNTNANYKSPKDHFFGMASIFLIVATVFLGALLVKGFGGDKIDATPSISVSGKGEVYAVPDVALVTFSIREEAKTSKEATDKLTTKEDAALAFLKSKGIEEKDIKTLWFNTYPKYEYTRSTSICTPEWCPPSDGKQVVVGYEATENIQVKVRDVDTAGDIISGLTEVGINEVNGPEFSVDDPESLKEEARRLAIEDAKARAEILKKDLGVRIVRIISFSEGGDYPIYYGAAMGGDMVRMDTKEESAPELNLSTGEQKITSNVTIVYEIK